MIITKTYIQSKGYSIGHIKSDREPYGVFLNGRLIKKYKKYMDALIDFQGYVM